MLFHALVGMALFPVLGLTVLPFLAGERSPYYNGAARGAIVDLSLDTTSVEILRAFIEEMKARDPAFTGSAAIPELLLKNSDKGREMLREEFVRRAAEEDPNVGYFANETVKPWAAADAPAAAKFGTTVPESMMPMVFHTVAEVWCAKDGSAAVQWAAALPAAQ